MRDILQNFNPDPDAPVAIDYMVPKEQHISMGGNWARRLLENELDVGSMRPMIDEEGLINNKRPGQSYITRNYAAGWDMKTKQPIIRQQFIPTYNDTNATLRILDWIQLDEAIVRAAKPRLRIIKDMREAGLVYMLPNGIAKTVMQFQTGSDITGATVSMDGLRKSESDRPVFSTVNFPLPIIHKDFSFPLRQVLASRTGYSPLDTYTAELAGRKVAEQAEQLALGASNTLAVPGDLTGATSYSNAGDTLYGIMNWPGRITYSLTLPTTSGWTPQQTIDDILAMKTASQQQYHTGPWMIYFGLYWDRWMDNDYKPTYNDTSLRQRIREIDGIIDARTVDYIPDQSIVLVQQSTDVIRLVIGMDITTVQWESQGGWELNFKVLCVMLPQLRGDFYGNTGIVHGS